MKFQHDCDRCYFVGRFDGKDGYVHPGQSDGQGWSIVLRDGNEGHEYSSTPLFIVLDEVRYPSDHAQIITYRNVWKQYLSNIEKKSRV